ncbi:winged-helix domain-containing protein [Tepidibacillus sp. HK-1]|uniref:winged-helix domain-containing protein n=1 Tax=Tepidibacillus sp. HK-1 TaxID=1883407 RepID=UPI000852F174|nr:winged-helix domain-containing protein [Tepidibacillus sp. HK-1]GBF10066.1 hypothetical protein HK1_00078 [Tepidibacillus sp. HK-1]
MNNEKFTIYIVAVQMHTAQFMMKQIIDIGKDLFVCELILLEDLSNATKIKKNTAILISSPFIKRHVEKFISIDTKLIVVRRNLNYTMLRPLFSLPKGTDILVVNDIWENTIETTKLLRETGIELNFIPYVPGESVQSQVNIAVTPNEERFVPEQIEKVINIGDRILDLSIYYELIQFYQLEEVYYNLITNRYMKSILKLAKELDHEVSEIVKMNHQDQQLSKEESKQIEKAKMHLEKYGMLYDGILILNEYLEGKKQGKSFGRNSLRKTLQKKGYDFSEQQLRTRISLLGKYGLLIIRSGRLGTTISPLGENFLEKLTRKRKIKN